MCESATQQSENKRRRRLNNLAMQFATQLEALCDEEKDAHEVADRLHAALTFMYQHEEEIRPITVLKVVG